MTRPAAPGNRPTRHEGAPHAFNADYRPRYRKEAAEDGWRRMLAFFKRHRMA